ncbi:hypothetical protein PVAG01_00612 [Phlyctema vagabunda]|uniref:Uncharacterized protein n=1 Tax=Phlyctema vagabunda TaxID=108571 RepID=A0ABR4PV67_9HELO
MSYPSLHSYPKSIVYYALMSWSSPSEHLITMNWTGGGLSRAGRNGGRKGIGLTPRQKAHYASIHGDKTKSAARSRQPRHPLSEKHIERPSVAGIRATTPLLGHQSPEDDYDATPPPKRVKAGKGSMVNGGINSYDFMPSARIEEGAVKQEPGQEENYYDATPPKSARHGGTRRELPESTLEDNLYDASPIPEKRQSDDAPEQEGKAQEKYDAILSKKRKLLLQRDWVGLQVSKFAKSAYVVPRQDANIGRRRKLRDGHRARYRTSQSIITSPFRKGNSRQVDGVRDAQSPGLLRSEMRISIGEPVQQDHPFRPNSSHRQLRELREPWSDMLLQDNGSSYKVDARSRASNRPSNSSWNGISTSLSHNVESTASGVALRGEHFELAPGYGVETGKTYGQNFTGYSTATSSGVKSKFQRNGYVWPSPLIPGITRTEGNPSQDRHRAFKDTQSNGEARRVAPTREISPRQEQQPEQMLVSSSVATVHHPQPRRSDTRKFLSQVLSSISSEHADSGADSVAGSVVGQDNQQEENKTASAEEMENAIWDSWTVPVTTQPGDGECIVEYGDYNEEDTAISQASIGCQSVVSFGNLENKESQAVASAVGAVIGESMRNSFLESKHASSGVDAGPSSPLQPHFLSEFEQENIDSLAVDHSRRDNNPSLSPPAPKKKPLASTHRPKVSLTKPVDSDEEWRKFACGTSSEESNNGNYSLLKDPGSSVRPAPATSVLASLSDDDTSLLYMRRIRKDPNTQFTGFGHSTLTERRSSLLTRQMQGGPSRASSLQVPSRYKTSRMALGSSEPIRASTEDERNSQNQADSEVFGVSDHSPADSMLLDNHSMRPAVSSSDESNHFINEERRIVFSKPKPFLGETRTRTERGVLHIRRDLVGKQRQESRLSESTETGIRYHAAADDLDSIEDDYYDDEGSIA